jgi:hypothetical protein
VPILQKVPVKSILVMGLVLSTVLLFATGVANSQLDGGHGGTCTRDIECGACGWICSAPRGRLCIPAFEGDPGSCIVDADCACAGQTCSGGHCAPLAHPECRCDSDCPFGSHCNQLVFACQTSPCDNVGYGIQYANGCQNPYFPPECTDDIECSVSLSGTTCVPSEDGGFPPPGCGGHTSGAWCRDTLDSGRPLTAASDGGADSGALVGNQDLAGRSCGCSYSAAGGTFPAALGGLLALLSLHRKHRRVTYGPGASI